MHARAFDPSPSGAPEKQNESCAVGGHWPTLYALFPENYRMCMNVRTWYYVPGMYQAIADWHRGGGGVCRPY